MPWLFGREIKLDQLFKPSGVTSRAQALPGPFGTLERIGARLAGKLVLRAKLAGETALRKADLRHQFPYADALQPVTAIQSRRRCHDPCPVLRRLFPRNPAHSSALVSCMTTDMYL